MHVTAKFVLKASGSETSISLEHIQELVRGIWSPNSSNFQFDFTLYSFRCDTKAEQIYYSDSYQAEVSKRAQRQLDIRGTRFPENLVGHWNALMLYYDVGEEPEMIHKAIFPQLCPIE